MGKKRVLLINVRSLLIEGVESILRSEGNGGFEVVSTLVSELPDLICEIELVKPEVIVLDEITSFVNPAELIVSLLNTGFVRLIVLNNRTSKMEIYDKSESVISNSDLLIEAINEGHLYHPG